MSVCDKVISLAQKISVDECESVFCTKKTITIRITDSEIAEIKENHDRSIGIRLVKDKRISSAQSNASEYDKIIQEALHAGKNLSPREFWKSFPVGSKDTPIEKTNDPKLWEMDSARATELAQSMIDHTIHQKITRISGSLNIVCDDFEIANTSGLHKSEKSTYISGLINADSEIGTPVSGIGQANSRVLDLFDAAKIGEDASQMCVSSINPDTIQNKTASIILEPQAVGELLYFVLGPNFNLKTFSEGRSCFSEIGAKITVDDFSLVDDPHAPNSLGAKSFDDEGVPTNPRHYIRDGAFEGTFSDTYNALKENTISTGNACRFGVPLGRSTDPIPVSAPHNLSIIPGSQTRDEIIQNTQDGIVVGRLWYTYPINPIKGDFSCTARSGIFQIKNGQIKPIKSVRIIHNLPILLQNISAIGNNSKVVLPWAGLPVTCPTIKCDGIPVSSI
ncbi:TldD/PmbA family protein [Candidatus Nitrosotenuis aquarius]|uniref:TldD/PmbA family protein n=1 Tax=Candidatus Nitrosotenuis aquarius TaxID=1846278 RepID=UPI000C1E585D|nr:TldD/PmbA family protein [Candidatus Nitrosotenuis aquarius]